MIKRICPGLAVLILLVAAAALGAESTAPNVLIYPARHELTIEAGKKATNVINVGSDAKFAVPLQVALLDWNIDPNGRPLPGLPGSLPSSLAAWIKFNPRSFELPQGATQTVRFTVSVPAGTKPGERRGLISISQKTEGEGINVGQQVWVTIYVVVPPAVKQLRCESISVLRQGKNPYLLASFTCPGNTHIKASGSISLIDQKGATVGTVKLTERVFFPGLPAASAMPLADLRLPAGTYRARLEMIDNTRQLILRHEAEIQL